VTHPPTFGRRIMLRTAVAGVAGTLFAAGASACTPASNTPAQNTPAQDTPAPAEPTPAGSASPGPTSSASPESTAGVGRVLLAYFSRAGENYYYGDRIDLEVGNTQVLAGMIKELTGCDVYRIEEADPYPESYDATRDRNSAEQRANARPAIANALPSIEQYDTVLLASGIWGNRAPMIMNTFTEALDFSGKTIHPVTTYAVSGLGSTERDYAASCPGATLGEGIAVRGEEVKDAGADVGAWLRRTGLLTN
jgi:flavodoxin